MTDSQTLLADYVQSGSDAAFRELVNRYVDLVYSTALRLVDGDRHRVEDVAQTVFVDLARTARTLSGEVKLGGWLHRHTCFVAAKTMRGERRRQSRERQAVEMNALQDNSEANFSLVGPILDEAINELGEADRTAILLRFFEQQDFRSVGVAIGSNEDAARMRVTRALEKLQELLMRHGVTTSAGALSVALSAHVVQAAPAGLAITISTAAALAGPTIVTTATATKAIAMTTLQKSLIAATFVAAVGTGIYEARQASTLQSQVQMLQQQQATLVEQIQQMTREREDATGQVATLRDENERLNRKPADLLKLRGEVTRLRQNQQELAQLKANGQTNGGFGDALAKMIDNPELKNQMRRGLVKSLTPAYGPLFKELNLTPAVQEQLIALMADNQMLLTDKRMTAMKGGDKVELQKEMVAATEKFNEETEALLGNDRFKQFKGFTKTVADRANFDRFEKQLGDNPLTGDQAQQLLEIMIQERANAPSANRSEAEILANTFDSGADLRSLHEQEQLDQQVRSRAAAFLNPPQLDVLAKFQTDTLGMLKMAISMRQKMFGEKPN